MSGLVFGATVVQILAQPESLERRQGGGYVKLHWPCLAVIALLTVGDVTD